MSADARALRMEGGDAARSMADRGFLLRPLASGSLLSCTFCPVLGGVDVTGRRPCRTPCPEGSSLLTPGARRLLRCRPQSRASLWTMSSGGRPWDRRLRPPTSVLKRTPEGARPFPVCCSGKSICGSRHEGPVNPALSTRWCRARSSSCLGSGFLLLKRQTLIKECRGPAVSPVSG